MRRYDALLLGLLLMALNPWATHASEALSKVHAVAEATDAVSAQRKALAQGEERAFYEVLKARDPQRADLIFSKVTAAQRSILLKSVSVENENARAGRYEADITYVFEESKIKALLQEQQGVVTDMEGNGVLLLPLYIDGKTFMLWEPENFWRSTLSRQVLERGRGQLVVPFGDPKDAIILPSATLLGNAKEPILQLARRYGTVNVAIVTARLKEMNGKRVAEIRLRRPGQADSEETVQIYTAESHKESPERLLQRAGLGTIEKLLAASTEFSLFAKPESQKLKGRVVRAEFPQWKEWTAIRQKMDGLPGVEFVDIGAISSNYAQLTLYYRGEEKAIEQALAGRGLNISTKGEYWTIALP
jgi:hypothetical protein